jgi:hypothetical protein
MMREEVYTMFQRELVYCHICGQSLAQGPNFVVMITDTDGMMRFIHTECEKNPLSGILKQLERQLEKTTVQHNS